VADIVCPVLSCKGCSLEGMNLNPFENAKAFDRDSYELITCMKAQGLPQTVCILQDLETIPQKKAAQVKNLFHRFFTSEFDKNDRIVDLEGPQSFLSFLRIVQSADPPNLF